MATDKTDLTEMAKTAKSAADRAVRATTKAHEGEYERAVAVAALAEAKRQIEALSAALAGQGEAG